MALESPQLSFHPEAFYALGSPIALFQSIKGHGLGIPAHYSLPTCPRVYNIYHPYDPVAYRIEPLIDENLRTKTPQLIDNHETGGLTFVYQLQHNVDRFSNDVSQGIQKMTHLLKPSTWENIANKFASSFLPTSTSSTEVQVEESIALNERPLPGIMLNNEDRIDFALQESVLASSTAYMASLSCHVGYFEDKDVA
eukprot:gene37510-49091_t